MTEQQIVEALIARDEQVTEQFFFGNCRPLFLSIIRNVFSYDVDYDEFVNEFYLYLMENNAYRLRQFQGSSTIYQWMKVVAIRYFIAKRNKMIEEESKEPLLDYVTRHESVDREPRIAAKIDIDTLLSQLANRRYAYLLRRLILDDAEPAVVAEEMEINVDNLYNIKRRAIAALTAVALKDVEKYGKNGR